VAFNEIWEIGRLQTREELARFWKKVIRNIFRVFCHFSIVQL